jgi:hypothetical protein
MLSRHTRVTRVIRHASEFCSELSNFLTQFRSLAGQLVVTVAAIWGFIHFLYLLLH